jgi:hypothetical protein
VVHIRLSGLRLRRPRQWGACWLACQVWDQLRLDNFWLPRLPPSRQGTRWLNVPKTLVTYRLIDPGSEWRLHRLWYDQSAMADLLGADFALAQKDNLYRCLDKLPAHRTEMFSFLQQRWKSLFAAEFEVLLYDLTSTYFECDPPAVGKRRFGYSRDKRSDCVQVVIALIVTPDGLPLAYEVMAGNTADKTTLRDFIKRIETQYGKAKRTWVMDRGIPTEEVLSEMRASETPVYYLVGTPRGRLSQLEEDFLTKPWAAVRDSVQVKLVEQDGELYILARSEPRRQGPALRHGHGIDPCQHPDTPRPSMAAQCIRHHAVDIARRCRRGTGIRSIPQVKHHQTPHSLAVPAGLHALRSDPQHAGGAAVTVDRAVHCHARGTPAVCRYFRGGVKTRGVLRGQP